MQAITTSGLCVFFAVLILSPLTAVMDPLAALHLVTTVAGVAYSVISHTYTIFQAIKTVKDAPKHAQELQKEIIFVASLLQQLEEIVTQPDFTASTALKEDLNDFKSMLDEMNDKMAIVKAQRLEQVKWPFTIKETQEKLSKLERYNATFKLALIVDIA